MGKGALKLLATVVVTVFVLRAVGFSVEELRLLDFSTWTLRPAPLVGSVVALVAGYFMSAALWGRMVHELGGPMLGTSDAVRVFMIANLGRYIPGKVWQIAGLAILAKSRGVPSSVAGAAAVVGQVIGLAGATLVGLGVFLVSEDDRWLKYGEWGVLAVLALVIVISVPATLDLVVAWISRLAKQEPPKKRYGRSTFGVRWLILYTLNWGIYSFAFWLLYLGLQPYQPFWLIGPPFAAAYVIGYAALFAPAGAGVREGMLITFLSPITGPAVGGALAIVARAWTTIVELIPAGLFWMSEQRAREKGR